MLLTIHFVSIYKKYADFSVGREAFNQKKLKNISEMLVCLTLRLVTGVQYINFPVYFPGNIISKFTLHHNNWHIF